MDAVEDSIDAVADEIGAVRKNGTELRASGDTGVVDRRQSIVGTDEEVRGVACDYNEYRGARGRRYKTLPAYQSWALMTPSRIKRPTLFGNIAANLTGSKVSG